MFLGHLICATYDNCVGEIGVKRWKVKFEETIQKESNERGGKRDKSLIDK